MLRLLKVYLGVEQSLLLTEGPRGPLTDLRFLLLGFEMVCELYRIPWVEGVGLIIGHLVTVCF